VRSRILALAESRPSYYDTAKFGIPASDLDSLGTLAGFSSAILWQALPRQGIFPTACEAEDYVALWRFVGHLLGVPTEPYFVDAAAAKRILEVILLYEIKPSETSRNLAHNMIAALASKPPLYASSDMLVASARWLNGHALSNALGLPHPGVYYYVLMMGQCCFFAASGYSSRLSARWDAYKQNMLRSSTWSFIVTSKDGLNQKESKFNMEWGPSLDKITKREVMDEQDHAQRKNIEIRNRRTAMFVMALALGLLLTIWKLFAIAIENLLHHLY